MIGPVLYLEMLLGSRRGRQYIFRWLYAGWLILQLLFLYMIYRIEYQATSSPPPWGTGRPDANATSRFAGSFVEMFVVQQLILMLLTTPAFAAGAITDEKTRGTLQYLLTADLTAWEIVLGKLLGRVAQVAMLALAGLPVLCFIGVFGGLHPVMLLAVFAITVLPLLALGAASLLASVWSKQTRDAVLGLYAIGTCGFLVVWGSRQLSAVLAGPALPGVAPGRLAASLARFAGLLQYFNPLYVLEPAWGGEEMEELGKRLLASGLAWGGIGIVCTALSVWRLRGAYVRQLENAGKKKKARWWRAERIAVAKEPIRWKERHVEGVAPLVVLRQVPRWLGIVAISAGTVLVSGSILWAHLSANVTFDRILRLLAKLDFSGLMTLMLDSAPAGHAFLVQGIVVMLLASLVVGIRCSGAVSGERERQTWEALLLTPLETRHLIRGKVWGIIGASYPYLIAYAVPAILLAMLGGVQAVFWVVLWLAVTWLAMYFVGAAGIWCSVRSKSSWRSLLGTLGFGYVGGFVLFVLTSPATFILALIILMFLALIDQFYGTNMMGGIGVWGAFFFEAFFIASCLVLAGIFFFAAWYFLADAEKRVSDRERTRHWKDEPVYRPRRRPVKAKNRYYR